MSPAELNGGLIRFLDLAPKLDMHGEPPALDSAEFAEILSGAERRESNSQLLETMIPALERLLKRSNGTESFKRFILGRVRGLYMVGQTPADFEGGAVGRVLGEILGADDSEGGIFSDKVQVFENASYAMAVFELSFLRNDELAKELMLAEKFAPRYAAWRGEFIKRYGDEPDLPKFPKSETPD